MIGASLLLALALQQGGAVTVQALTDRDKLGVGEELVLTVSASSASTASLSLVAPTFEGFTLIRRTESREVGTAWRSQVWEIHLRADRVGSFALGPVQVVQGGTVISAPAISVEVTAAGAGVSAQLSPRLREMLAHAPPPPDSGAQLTILVSDTSVVVGQQVDVVSTAWFPRDLRLRLRRQPTLEPPSFSGVWNYPQPVPPGIVGTREVNGVWYDQFVYHQVIFPITPGSLSGGTAILHYSVPLAFQFFSQEERYDLARDVPGITVHAVPDSGRPDGYDGVVGSGIVVTREIEGTPRVGEPVSVRFEIAGRGNVALWPPPAVAWPGHVQVYPEGTDEKLDALGGILGGTRTFRYLVVPDSSGVLAIPNVSYH
ncbi:MAG TPA: BatD family protein, partial [Gemmatimonadales bacterium]|nr:BatD family protein [Gemmatimonadales bacterium]